MGSLCTYGVSCLLTVGSTISFIASISVWMTFAFYALFVNENMSLRITWAYIVCLCEICDLF